MAKYARNLTAILAVVGTMAASTMARAQDVPTTAPSAPSRVRSSAPAIAAMIREASAQSATFRGLVETIEATDGIVYVEQGVCGRGMRACLVGITTAGANRLVWLKVDARKVGLELAVSVGHELRHAVEVLVDSDVANTKTLYSFYIRQTQRGMTGAFETDAALAAGSAVRAELGRARIQ